MKKIIMTYSEYEALKVELENAKAMMAKLTDDYQLAYAPNKIEHLHRVAEGMREAKYKSSIHHDIMKGRF